MIHYMVRAEHSSVVATEPSPAWGSILCGAKVLSRNSMTTEEDHLTCPDCCVRLLAIYQQKQNTLIKSLAGGVVCLKAQIDDEQTKARTLKNQRELLQPLSLTRPESIKK